MNSDAYYREGKVRVVVCRLAKHGSATFHTSVRRWNWAIDGSLSATCRSSGMTGRFDRTTRTTY